MVDFSCRDSSSSNLGGIILINSKMVKLWLDVATCEGVNEPILTSILSWKVGQWCYNGRKNTKQRSQ